MKKTILIISVAILTLTTVKSQEKINFGVKGGIYLQLILEKTT